MPNNIKKNNNRRNNKKIRIIKAYKDNLSDASVIRFEDVTNLINFNTIFKINTLK